MRPPRSRVRLTLAAVACAGALGAPASALASSPISGVPTSAATTVTQTTGTVTTATLTTTSSGTGGGLSSIDTIGIGVVVLALFGSIAYIIRSDARLHTSRRATIDIDRERATVQPRAERIKRSRAKAKAARRARRAGR